MHNILTLFFVNKYLALQSFVASLRNTVAMQNVWTQNNTKVTRILKYHSSEQKSATLLKKVQPHTITIMANLVVSLRFPFFDLQNIIRTLITKLK